jgi:hypothetical protein
MQITVTNTSAPLTSLLSASDLALAETNRGGNNEYEILAYNADSTSTDIVYYTFGETATASEGIPLFAPSGATSAGDAISVFTGDLSKINLISSAAETTLNLIIKGRYVR